MDESSSGAGPAGTVEQRVERERLRLLFEAIPGFTLLGGLMAVALAVVLWDAVSRPLLAGWLLSHILVGGARLASLRAFRRHGGGLHHFGFWQWLFLAGTAAVGLVWGLFALLIFPAGATLEQALLAIGMAGVSVGGVINLSVSRAAGLALLLPLLGPVMGRLLFEGSPQSILLMVMLLVFLVVVYGGNRHLAAILQRSLSLQVQAGDRESRYASLFHHSPLGVFHYDDRGVIVDCNEPFVGVIGSSYRRLLGLDLLHDLRDDAMKAAVRDSLERGSGYYEGLYESVTADKVTPVRVHLKGIRHASGTITGGVGIIEDCSESRAAQAASDEREQLLQRLAENVPGMIYQLRQHGDTGRLSMPFVSGKIREVFGMSPEAVRDDASVLFQTVHPEDAERTREAVTASATRLTPFHQQFRVILDDPDHPSGRIEWVEVISLPRRHSDGGTVWDGFATRITERKALEEQLRQQAFYDPLTGLPNRTLVQDRLDQGIRDARRDDRRLVLMYVDLDGFKDINDAWGHGLGDRLLHQVAERLRTVMRENDTLGRIGGDEFVVVARETGRGEQSEVLASRVIDALANPFELEGQSMRVTASIGLSLFPDDGTSSEDLMRHADAALYRAKAHGTGQWAWYKPELTEAARARRQLENELRSALDRNGLSVALQPIVALSDGRVTGYEALARWHHGQAGWISPARFIPVAESRGMVAAVGGQVYRKAFAALGRFPGDGEAAPRLSINIAPRQLQERGFGSWLLDAIRAAGLNPARIEVEITEEVFMGDPAEPLCQLRRLRAEGVTVSIDDFGTGFSSLSYLRELPIDRLKIDMAFVRDVHKAKDKAAIVNTIIALAREFGLQVTAEGIECREEAEHLRGVGCDGAQGFYFGRPELVVDDTG